MALRTMRSLLLVFVCLLRLHGRRMHVAPGVAPAIRPFPATRVIRHGSLASPLAALVPSEPTFAGAVIRARGGRTVVARRTTADAGHASGSRSDEALGSSTYEDAVRFSDEIYELTQANSPPKDVRALRQEGWKNISTPNAMVLHKYDSDPGIDVVYMDIQSQRQAPGLEFMNVTGDSIGGGWLPGIWSIPFWKYWFPFCEEAVIMKRFSPDLVILRLRLRVLFVVFDTVLLFGVFDNIDKDGSIHIVARSPPKAAAGKKWLGVTIPPNVGKFSRMNYLYKITLTGRQTCDLILTGFLDEDLGAPSWLKQLAFKQYGKSIFAQLQRLQEKAREAGHLDFLNGISDDAIDGNSRNFLLGVHKRAERYLRELQRR